MSHHPGLFFSIIDFTLKMRKRRFSLPGSAKAFGNKRGDFHNIYTQQKRLAHAEPSVVYHPTSLSYIHKHTDIRL